MVITISDSDHCHTNSPIQKPHRFQPSQHQQNRALLRSQRPRTRPAAARRRYGLRSETKVSPLGRLARRSVATRQVTCGSLRWASLEAGVPHLPSKVTDPRPASSLRLFEVRPEHLGRHLERVLTIRKRKHLSPRLLHTARRYNEISHADGSGSAYIANPLFVALPPAWDIAQVCPRHL